MDKIYQTVIIDYKRKPFMQYLRNLGLLESSVSLKKNGDYYIVTISLNEVDDVSSLWQSLNKTQTSFLK